MNSSVPNDSCGCHVSISHSHIYRKGSHICYMLKSVKKFKDNMTLLYLVL